MSWNMDGHWLTSNWSLTSDLIVLTMWKALPALLQYLDLNIGLSFGGSRVLMERVEWSLIFFKCLSMRFMGNPLLYRLCLCFKMIL